MAVKSYRGTRVKRIEDPRLLVGRGQFVDDLNPAGVWHVVIVRSPHAHARIRGIRARGNQTVITARYLGKPIWVPGEVASGKFAQHPVLAMDRACYVGQPVAAVVGKTLAEAADAAAEVEVDYDPLPALVDPEEALRNNSPTIHPQLKTNIVYREAWKRGKVDAAFRDAPVRISQRIAHQRVAAITLEGRAVLAAPAHGDRTLTVWSSTQMPHALRDALVEIVPARVSVRVIAPDVGGGFGAKGNIYPEEFLIPLLALRFDRPLKWAEQRGEHLQTISHGRSQFADVSVAATQAGQILGLRLHVIADIGAYVLATTAFIPPLTLQMATGPYDIRAADVDLTEVYTTKAPTGAYRGAGRPEATFYLERALDILATEVGIDPAEIRRRNFIPHDQFPYRALSGLSYDSGNYTLALDRALAASNYKQRRQQQRQPRADERLLGVGLSSYVETCTYGNDASRVLLDRAGKATVYSGTSPHGQGGATAFAQIVADVLGIDVTDVTVIHGDTALIPEGMGTAGSRTLVVGGSAVYRASEVVRKKLLARAARKLEAAVEDLVLARGRVHVAGVPTRGLTLAELIDSHPLLGTGRYTVRGSTFPFGTHVAVVEVDRDTGAVHLLEHVAVDDCGVVINPLLVEGQIYGGVAQAIGQAIYEDVYYDRAGQLLTGSLVDYAIPRALAMPPIILERTQTPSPRNPLGAKGVGEAGTIGATPAVVNAVIDALARAGVRHLDMPLTPQKIWAALHRQRSVQDSGVVQKRT